MNLPRIMIAAANSGAGKTTVTSAILAALKAKNMNVAAFKCGPDYIDTYFHKAATGQPSRNLDTFLMGENGVKASLYNNSNQKDIAVIEGVMGYYDGVGAISTVASSYDVSRVTNTPVVLVVNCKGLSLSAAAIIKGFIEFRQDSAIKGVILNCVNKMIYPKLKEVIENELNITVFGYLPKSDTFKIKSRHLGLVVPNENDNLSFLAARNTIDIEGLINLANTAMPINKTDIDIGSRYSLKIGVAHDEAFLFYYADNLDLLRRLGCEIVHFSPIHDKMLPKDIDGLMLFGGYPEIHAKALSENTTMIEDIKAKINSGMPVIAECGGFLYLHKYLQDTDAKPYPMVGVIDGMGYATSKLVRFGYHNITSNTNGFLPKGKTIPAHSFHYWESDNNGNALTASKPLSCTSFHCGHVSQSLWASFSHVHFYGAPQFITGFLDACERQRIKRLKD